MALSSTIRSELSDRELSLLAAAFASLAKTDRNVNWEKFTQLAGYGSVNSARVNFRPVVKKLDTIVENGCKGGGVCDGDQKALPKAATAPQAPKAKKNNAAAKPTAKTRGRPKKRKHGEEEAVSEDMQANQAGVQGIGLGILDLEAAKQSFAGVARAATVGGAGACPSLAAPENGRDEDAQQVLGPAVDASGSAVTYTGPFPEASRLVPALGPTPAMDPGNDDYAAVVVDLRTAAEQPDCKKLKVVHLATGPCVKTDGDDLAISRQLAREACHKLEEADKKTFTPPHGPANHQNITDIIASEDARLNTDEVDVKSIFEGVSRLGHGADSLPTSVEATEAASPEMEASTPFQDQRFSYADSLDFGFEDYAGLEDAI
ncbi:hypothetical protein F503_03815 [Ophiostoma piceae UAMH 11346]|uniref:Myb-like domain-containing protein n=1 Tax=Ophiostoma piceae (strain UAMH 11346) TaxID=1262450 RepID=S3CWQ0_OPHP1|nr:hypothetical protein F503_03815 [Ophiostoma piceae UAMH 11346]